MINRSANELTGIVKAGGSIEVDGTSLSAIALKGIAAELHPGTYMKIYNTEGKTPLELASIAKVKPGQVIFA
ncbi:hypothetical protein [Labrys wisconsinensis]|jgi:hypothetical protein|uniref:Uncharacterized protein n=1 Tax=Labrys wisconsinensis TaxID=425677 RepID=A0ABU0JGF2_9HYPH|nr:hypothetical protein [Labrys wisconsinensis]MDQ0472334.1 hypothetical protein [Labrys wisconsinensis]